MDIASARPDRRSDESELPPAQSPRIAIVIPCYRAGATIGRVLAGIGPVADRIYVVDDACPEGSGDIAAAFGDPRVRVLRNARNCGVGGAVKRGYAEALQDGAQIAVKLDADDQMDPVFIPRLIAPLAAGEADYAKGNRFGPRHAAPAGRSGTLAMPPVRRIGNNMLSFLHKGVTGYWNIVDPTNGYTAVHRRALETIDLAAVADCYFFETDMLFQLNLAGAVVLDVPLPAHYGEEVSSLRVRGILRRFPRLAAHRFLKRIAIRYFLEDFSVGSLEMLLGLPLLLFGTILGFYHWIEALRSGVPSTAGTVMFAALPIIVGFQLLLSAVSFDIANRPRVPISRQPPPAR